MLKKFILRWFGLPVSDDAMPPAAAPMAEAKDPTEVELAKWQMNALHQRMSANYENTLRQVFMLQAKVNAMSDVLGVVVVFSDEDSEAAVISISDESKLAMTKDFVDAWSNIERASVLHYKSMQDQSALFSQLLKKHREEMLNARYKAGRVI